MADDEYAADEYTDEEDEDYVVETEEEAETEEEDDESYASEEEDDGAGDREQAEEWQGASVLPARTWEQLVGLVRMLSEAGKTELTVLLLGKPTAGRSSTANSLLCEAAAEVYPGLPSQATTVPEMYLRQYGDFLLKIVDTPHLMTGNRVNPAAFQMIADALGKRKVDVVLYVDRLDVYRIEPLDKQLLRAITNHFGRGIWQRTIVALTRGGITPPSGYDFAAFTQKRTAQLQDAIRQCGGGRATPTVIIENSSRCRTNEQDQRILPDGTVWMAQAMKQIVDVALEFDDGMRLKFIPYNPNRRRLWMIPLMIAAQFAIKKLLLDPMIEADGWRGDRHGDYDEETRREEKLLAETRKRDAKRAEERRKKIEEAKRSSEQKLATSLAANASKSSFRSVQYDDDDDDDVDDSDAY